MPKVLKPEQSAIGSDRIEDSAIADKDSLISTPAARDLDSGRACPLVRSICKTKVTKPQKISQLIDCVERPIPAGKYVLETCSNTPSLLILRRSVRPSTSRTMDSNQRDLEPMAMPPRIHCHNAVAEDSDQRD